MIQSSGSLQSVSCCLFLGAEQGSWDLLHSLLLWKSRWSKSVHFYCQSSDSIYLWGGQFCLEALLNIAELVLFNVCVHLWVKLCFYCLVHVKFQANMGNGSISFCGLSMDWNDVLADYEGKFWYITVLTWKWQQKFRKIPILFLASWGLRSLPNTL